jgi:hypothetical protein
LGSGDRKHRAGGRHGGLRRHPPVYDVSSSFVERDDAGRIVVADVSGGKQHRIENDVLSGRDVAGGDAFGLKGYIAHDCCPFTDIFPWMKKQ